MTLPRRGNEHEWVCTARCAPTSRAAFWSRETESRTAGYLTCPLCVPAGRAFNVTPVYRSPCRKFPAGSREASVGLTRVSREYVQTCIYR